MKIQKTLLGAIWLFISLINPVISSAQIHTSGNVEFHIIGSGSLSAIREDELAANFRFPKSGDSYYLHELSEIWVGDDNGNVASTWDLDLAELRLGDGEWAATSTNIEGIILMEGRQLSHDTIHPESLVSAQCFGCPAKLFLEHQ